MDTATFAPIPDTVLLAHRGRQVHRWTFRARYRQCAYPHRSLLIATRRRYQNRHNDRRQESKCAKHAHTIGRPVNQSRAAASPPSMPHMQRRPHDHAAMFWTMPGSFVTRVLAIAFLEDDFAGGVDRASAPGGT